MFIFMLMFIEAIVVSWIFYHIWWYVILEKNDKEFETKYLNKLVNYIKNDWDTNIRLWLVVRIVWDQIHIKRSLCNKIDIVKENNIYKFKEIIDSNKNNE